jgi:hypothetical protein
MPEESTTPDLVERVRGLVGLAGAGTLLFMEHRHREALRRIAEADSMWCDDGHEPAPFYLMPLGGMRELIDHPNWNGSWPVFGPSTIDDLGELGVLRVEPIDPSRNKARTFWLTMSGREQAAALAEQGVPPIEAAADDPAPVAAYAAKRALVSWSHGDDAWTETILEFTSKLRGLGIDADVDLFHAHDADVNWTTYGPQAIEDYDFVLLAVSANFKQRWEGRNDPSTGAGTVREANVLKTLFNEDQGAFYRKVKVVVLPGTTTSDIPSELKAAVQHFEIDPITEAALEDLLRTLTGKPAYPRPPLGEVPALEPVIPGGGSGTSPSLGVVARLLIEELEISIDMIGNALQDGACWAAPWELPSPRWRERENRERIAQEGEALDKPVRDAYRKINEINQRTRTRQGEVQVGAVLEEGQGLDLTAKDRKYLRDHLGVITHAIGVLRGLASNHGGGNGGRAQAAGHPEKDAATFNAIRTVLPRPVLTYWSELDFGGVWYREYTNPLLELFEGHDSVEDRFLDPGLEDKRRELVDAAKQLFWGCAKWGVRRRSAEEGFELGLSEWVRDNPPDGKNYDRWEELRTELAAQADRLVAAYDALVEAARAKLPGV